MTSRTVLLIAGCLWLAGCAGQRGCQAAACDRPESQPGQLSVWWAPAMRAGLGTPDQPVDQSLIPVEE